MSEDDTLGEVIDPRMVLWEMERVLFAEEGVY